MTAELLLAPDCDPDLDPDPDPDAPDTKDESSDEESIVVKADAGTVDVPFCITMPPVPILIISPPDKVAAEPPCEMTVPSMVATSVTSAASYAVTGVPLTVKAIADAAVFIEAAVVPSTRMTPPDAKLTREPPSSV